VHTPAVALDDCLEEHEKELPVAGNDVEDHPLLDSTGAHVIEDVGDLDARFTAHASTVAASERSARNRHTVVSIDMAPADINRV
jgi:hypothetical protein